MTLLAPLTLVGRYVRLDPLADEHAPWLLAAASESRATYAFTVVPRDLAEMQAYIARALAERDVGRALPFVVRDGAGTIVGSTRYTGIEWWSGPGASSEPATPDAVEIGYTWYAERVQRTGLNTEAKLLLCTQAFERWQVRRVVWKTDVRNARSRAAIERLGARFDGVLRAERMAFDGRVRDTAHYSMLPDEWPDARGALRRRLDADRGAPHEEGCAT